MPDIDKAYTWAVQTCNAPNIGYSQPYRNQKTVNGVTYYDCSSFINYALLAGGFETPSYAPKNNAFTTVTEVSELLRLGFQEVDASGQILAGDIGLSSGHTEMAYSEGVGSAVFMGAHTANAALSNQVSIGSSSGDTTYKRSFPRLFRYGSGASGYGYSIYVVAALAGNSWIESHINPTVNQQGGTAFGLVQWDGGRKENLLRWLNENGYTDTDANGQMQYLIVENEWQGEYGGISSLEEFLNSDSTDLDTLVTAFCTCWERPGVPALEDRIVFAQKAIDYIQEHANDTSIVEWETEPMYYLSEEQALKNAVLMYRFYSAGGGGGGSVVNVKKSKIWMWINPIHRIF